MAWKPDVYMDEEGLHIGSHRYVGNDVDFEDVIGVQYVEGGERFKKLYNKKTKIYPNGFKKTTYCNQKKFRIALYGTEEKKPRSQSIDWWDGVPEEELSDDEREYIKHVLEERRECKARQNERRARDRVFDIVRLNYETLKLFVTVTFNPDILDSSSPREVIAPLQTWLSNRVKRYGLQYVLVPEYHKSGLIHCHIVTNDVFKLVDSGTRVVDGFRKPIKLETIAKYNIPESRIKSVVYNLPEWKLGWSTAIKVYGDSIGVAAYIAKYMTKTSETLDAEKIFGKRYWCSRNMELYAPVELENVSVSEFNAVPKLAWSNPYGEEKYKFVDNSVKKVF